MKHLYIIRHGETAFNKSKKMQGRGIDASLNEKGRKQAESVVAFFEGKSVSKIVTSSLKRAKESVVPLCKSFNLDAEGYTELDEMDFGTLEGKRFDDVKSDLISLHQNWSSGELEMAPDNGENPIQVYKRASSKIEEILELSKEEHIVFLLHGRLIRILLSEWLGLGLKNMHQIEHQNGAINYLTWDAQKFEAVELNIINHLDE